MQEIAVPDATHEPHAYADRLIEILGERDPLEVLAATPGTLTEIVATTGDDVLHARPDDDAWSVAEIISHLVDAALAYSFRWRLTLTKESPAYPGYDEMAFAQLPKPPLADALALFTALRAYDVWLLRHIPAADWQRTGIHAEQGPETVERNARKLAAHDLVHLNQIERTLAGVGC